MSRDGTGATQDTERHIKALGPGLCHLVSGVKDARVPRWNRRIEEGVMGGTGSGQSNDDPSVGDAYINHWSKSVGQVAVPLHSDRKRGNCWTPSKRSGWPPQFTATRRAGHGPDTTSAPPGDDAVKGKGTQ